MIFSDTDIHNSHEKSHMYNCVLTTTKSNLYMCYNCQSLCIHILFETFASREQNKYLWFHCRSFFFLLYMEELIMSSTKWYDKVIYDLHVYDSCSYNKITAARMLNVHRIYTIYNTCPNSFCSFSLSSYDPYSSHRLYIKSIFCNPLCCRLYLS